MASAKHFNRLALRLIKSWLALLPVIALWGCAGNTRHTPAPVETVQVSGKAGIVKPYKTLGGKRYKVQKGDTLYSIAWRSGQDFRQLAKINNISQPFKIYPQQIILLRAKIAKINKTKIPKTNPENKKTNSSHNVTKTLAQQKQQAYGQSKANKKPTPAKKKKPKVVKVNSVKKQQQKQSSKKPYSNKIRKWVWPVKGKIIAGFSNKENGNKGIDIGGKRGTSVIAAADGKVVYYGNALRGYGNLIIIKHNDDYLSAYAHNQKILVKEKDLIKAGQKIAEMGDSDSQNVKLHFEVRYRGKSVNPMKYLPKR